MRRATVGFVGSAKSIRPGLVGVEAFALFAVVAVCVRRDLLLQVRGRAEASTSKITIHEVVEVAAFESVFLQCEVQVGASCLAVAV